MKEQILKLRSEGKTYNEIKNLLKCSKSTISYYCGENQKTKTQERQKKYRANIKGILINKLSHAQHFKRKVHDNLKFKSFITTGEFTYSKIGREKFIETCIKKPICYWTGLPIDLSNRSEYELDHKIPCSKGGTNDFNNLVLAKKFANRMKSDLLPEDFLKYCKIIVDYNNVT